MIQYLYDNDIILYTYAGLCGLGVLLRLIVNLIYKHLVKESDNLGETKNKMLKHVKMKFETCFKLKIGVNNVDTFVDKNVLRYRFCGVLLSTWDNLCGQILYLNLLLVPILAVFGQFYQCGQAQILFAGAVGISSASILIIVDKSLNLSSKKKMLRLNLLDYLENFCKVRLKQESDQPELALQLRRELMHAAEASKQISASSETGKVEELNRRREERRRKEEEKKLRAAKREEELRKAEEARKEEERRRQEEKKKAAARRREEERLRMEEEREALEARREELKRKAQEKQQILEQKKHASSDKEIVLHSIEEDIHHDESESNMDVTMEGLEEIAAGKEEKLSEIEEKSKLILGGKDKEANIKTTQKASPAKSKTRAMSVEEEKLIEDVLREFFA